MSLLLGDKLNSDKLEFGLEGGLNWSNISGMETNNSARNFNLDFYFDFKVKNQWSVYTGVLVKSNMEVDKLTENDLEFLKVTRLENYEGTYSQLLSTFLVPCFAKYNFKKHFYVEAGPQFGLNHKAYIVFESNIDGIEIDAKEDNKDMIKKLDAGVAAGFGYKLFKGKGWIIDVKYYYGFVDVYKTSRAPKAVQST